MYFATHFKNYLDAAPIKEIEEYIADLAFWGMNSFAVRFDMHHFRNMEEGKTCSDRLYAMLAAARDLGVKTQLMILSNEAFAIEEAMKRLNGAVSEEVRSSARWQLFYLRGLIDAEFIRTGGERNERIFDLFYRLIDCCHLENAGSHTKPDVKTDGTWGSESHFET